MTPPEARHLEELLAALSRDIGEIKSACAVLVERSQRQEQDHRDLREDMETADAALAARLEALEARRWPLAQVAVVMTLAGLLLSGAGIAVGVLVGR